jgi:hypothetical protein
MGRPAHPKAERGADDEYVLWLDEGVSQPLYANRVPRPAVTFARTGHSRRTRDRA